MIFEVGLCNLGCIGTTIFIISYIIQRFFFQNLQYLWYKNTKFLPFFTRDGAIGTIDSIPLTSLSTCTLIDMREGTFVPFAFRIKLNFYQKFPNFFCGDTLPSSLCLIKMLLCDAKDEHFYCFHSSCQLRLTDVD